MKRLIPKASTGNRWPIFILDSSQTDGSGLTGLDESSADGVDAFYVLDDMAVTAITLAAIPSDGDYTSGGFEEIDAANMPGWYMFHPPNACFATGEGCGIYLGGAADMAPVNIEVQMGFAPAPELAAEAGKNPDLLQALMYWWMRIRNLTTTTATEDKVRNDAGAVIATAVVSDDTVTATKGKLS